MPHRMPLHLEPLTRPFTPVSPSNLDPITSRFQQVSIADFDHLRETLSGHSTPLITPDRQSSFFDEDDDHRREVRADAELPFPVNRDVLKEIVTRKMGANAIYVQFLSSGAQYPAML